VSGCWSSTVCCADGSWSSAGSPRPTCTPSLRQKGVYQLDGVRYVICETKGELTVVRDDVGAGTDPPLASRGLQDAAGR
jgi:hypothetical protein